jgi:hypothetical protein
MLKNKEICLNELFYGDVCKRSRAVKINYPDIQNFEEELLAAIDSEVLETLEN